MPLSHDANKDSPLTFPEALPQLLLLSAIFFTTFLARIIIAPLLPAIQAELNLDHHSAGNLFLVLSTGYFVSLVSTGYLNSRFQHRTLIITSCLGLWIALSTVALTPTLTHLKVATFLIGLAAGLYLPSGISAVTGLTRPAHWGRALAVHELAPNLAFILAPLTAELSLVHTTWRTGMVLLGVVALLLGLLYIARGNGTALRGDIPDRQAIQSLFRQPFLWLLIALFSLGISSTLGIYTMLPLYLVSHHGMDHASANTLLATSRIAALPMAFAGGWVADRFGPLVTIRLVFLAAGLLTVMLGLTRGPWLQGAVFCQPALAVCFFPAGFSALSSLSPPQHRSIAVSLVIPSAFLIGGGAVPYSIGWFGDIHLFRQAFVLIGLLITLGGCLTALLPPLDR